MPARARRPLEELGILEDGLVYEKAAGFTELVSTLVPWLQGRHPERSVLEYIVGVTEGFMEERGGFGRTVNIAARIADYARPHEVLVSEAAKRSAGVAEVEFELVGDVPLKWVSRSVRLHRARRA